MTKDVFGAQHVSLTLLLSVSHERNVRPDTAGRHTIALIIAGSEADAEYYALHELGFVKVDNTSLVSDCVYVAPDETEQ